MPYADGRDLFVTVAANDDASAFEGTSRVSFSAVEGTTYLLAVDGAEEPPGNVPEGPFTLNWRLEPAP
jgi:hypothetical protein